MFANRQTSKQTEDAVFLKTFVRSWRLTNQNGATLAEMEDNLHRFALTLHASDGRISAADATALRFPYNTCVEAEALLNKIVGTDLSQAPQLDRLERSYQCTHLLDMSGLAARHALRGENASLRYDATIELDPQTGPVRATLQRNNAEVLRWDMAGTMIKGPEQFAGLDILTTLPKFAYAQLQGDEQEAVNVLKRATHIGRNAMYIAQMAQAQESGAMANAPPTCHSLRQGLRARVMPDFVRDYSETAALLQPITVATA